MISPSDAFVRARAALFRIRIEKFEDPSGDRYEIGVLFDLVVEEQLEGVIGFLERFISTDDSDAGPENLNPPRPF